MLMPHGNEERLPEREIQYMWEQVNKLSERQWDRDEETEMREDCRHNVGAPKRSSVNVCCITSSKLLKFGREKTHTDTKIYTYRCTNVSLDTVPARKRETEQKRGDQQTRSLTLCQC